MNEHFIELQNYLEKKLEYLEKNVINLKSSLTVCILLKVICGLCSLCVAKQMLHNAIHALLDFFRDLLNISSLVVLNRIDLISSTVQHVEWQCMVVCVALSIPQGKTGGVPAAWACQIASLTFNMHYLVMAVPACGGSTVNELCVIVKNINYLILVSW